MIDHFSREVIEQIGYYVYRLIDPRDGQTFYVGKGRGNRLFAHVNNALENYDKESYKEKDETESTLKIAKIHQIKDAGLDVIHIIQRWGLTSHEAFLVESTLIDAFGFEQLSNIVKGHDSNHGVTNAETLERDLSCDYFVEDENNPKFMIIKTQNRRIDEVGRYDATRYCWKVSLWKVKDYPYVLSVTGGIVREVYKVTEWHPVGGDSKRKEFTGIIAEPKILTIFKNKMIPEKYKKKGMAQSVLYSK
jgi:hypothetical protein